MSYSPQVPRFLPAIACAPACCNRKKDLAGAAADLRAFISASRMLLPAWPRTGRMSGCCPTRSRRIDWHTTGSPCSRRRPFGRILPARLLRPSGGSPCCPRRRSCHDAVTAIAPQRSSSGRMGQRIRPVFRPGLGTGRGWARTRWSRSLEPPAYSRRAAVFGGRGIRRARAAVSVASVTARRWRIFISVTRLVGVEDAQIQGQAKSMAMLNRLM